MIIDAKLNGKEYTIYPRGGRCDLIANDLNYTVCEGYDGNGGFYTTITVKFRRRGSYRLSYRRVDPKGKIGRAVLARALFPMAA